MTAFVFLTELMWRREACASFDLFIKPQFGFSRPKPESWREEWMERKDKAGRRTEENWGELRRGDRKMQTRGLMESGGNVQIKRTYCKHAEPLVPQLCSWQSRLKPFHFLFLILLPFSGSEHKHYLLDKHSCLCTLGVLSFIKGHPNRKRVRLPLGKSKQHNLHIGLIVKEGFTSPVKPIGDSCRREKLNELQRQ